MIVNGFCLPTIFGRVAMMLISLVLIAIGVSAYVATNLINMPMEGMTLAITQKVKGKTFRQVKIVVPPIRRICFGSAEAASQK